MITPTLDDIGRMVRGAGQPDPAEPELVGTLIEIIVDGEVPRRLGCFAHQA